MNNADSLVVIPNWTGSGSVDMMLGLFYPGLWNRKYGTTYAVVNVPTSVVSSNGQDQTYSFLASGSQPACG